MATYTPANLITTKALGNGAGNIATWRYQASSEKGIVRTFIINTPTAARTVTIQQGATAGDTTAQRILDAYALTANVPYVFNGWIEIEDTHYFQGFANNTDINGSAWGYEYS